MEKIKKIAFPNTLGRDNQKIYVVGARESWGCDEIKRIEKVGEMAKVGWFQIIKDSKVMVEIKESVCNIYFN